MDPCRMVPNFVAAFSSEIYSGLEPLGTYVWISLTDFVIEYCFEDFGKWEIILRVWYRTIGGRTRFTEFYWFNFLLFHQKFLAQN